MLSVYSIPHEMTARELFSMPLPLCFVAAQDHKLSLRKGQFLRLLCQAMPSANRLAELW